MTLLERERELEAIEGVLDRGGVLIVEGGAGIGKTSLVNSACERGAAAGQEVLRGRGSELESGFEFGVVLQLFERRVAAAERSEAKSKQKDKEFTGSIQFHYPNLLNLDPAAPSAI